MELTRVVTIFSAKSRNLSLQPTMDIPHFSSRKSYLFALHIVTFVCFFPNQIHWQPSTSCCNIICAVKINKDIFSPFQVLWRLCSRGEALVPDWGELPRAKLSFLSHAMSHDRMTMIRVQPPPLSDHVTFVGMTPRAGAAARSMSWDHVISATVWLFAGREHRRRTNEFRSETGSPILVRLKIEIPLLFINILFNQL